MRRSAAPSSLPVQKKRRFQTPFISAPSHTSLLSSPKPNKVAVESDISGNDSTNSQLKLQEILKSIRKVPSSETEETGPSASVTSKVVQSCPTVSSAKYPAATPHFAQLAKKEPTSSSSRHEAWGTSGGAIPKAEAVPTDAAHYYSVMWCKRSSKKHKVWEGDAVLVVQGRSVVLKDMDGKDIGRGIGYKKSELRELTDGSTLVVGGKEVEIMGEVTEADYRSGKCFTGTGTDSTDVTETVMVVLCGVRCSWWTCVGANVPTTKVRSNGTKMARPFRCQTMSGTPAPHCGPSVDVVVSPAFDPQAPEALVMPRPGQKHQLEYNPKGYSLVDVVIDPHLAIHLRPHQRRGVVFLYQCVMGMKDYAGKGAILADEMGLGKTLQSIALVWTLLKQGPYGLKPMAKKVLIITPGSLVKNWEQEFRKWLGSERLKVFSVSGENKPENFVQSPLYPVLIISYEMFVRSQEVLSKTNFDLVICDEGHRLKNSGTKTTVVIGSLPIRRRILLTGTPIQNDLQEFFSLVDLCNPGILGSHAAFQRLYEGPIGVARQPGATSEDKEIGTARAEELKRLTSLFCLRRTQDVINQYLPPKVENVVFCRMSPLQTSIYKHLLNSALVKSCLRTRTWPSSGSAHQTPSHLVCISALKKLCNDPSLIYVAARKKEEERPVVAGDEEDEDASLTEHIYSEVLKLFPSGYDPREAGTADCGKLEVLYAMLHQLLTSTKEKVVLISNYTQTLDLLARLCSSHGYGALRLDGSTPSSKRQAIVDQFNSKHGRERVFLLSTKAGGVGLNLIGASRLVLYDVDWNPANDLQAMARVWRDGQRNKVHIYRLLTTGSIEEKIFQRQVTKQGLNTVMDFHGGVASGSGLGAPDQYTCSSRKKWEVSFTQEELRDLFSLREDTLCDTHDLVGCGCALRKEGVEEEVDDITTQKKATKRCGHAGIEELMQWSHHAHPVDQSSSLQDSLLTGPAASNITFVLQNDL